MKFQKMIMTALILLWPIEAKCSPLNVMLKYQTQEVRASQFNKWIAEHWSKYAGIYEYEYGDASAILVLQAYVPKGNKPEDVRFSACMIGPNGLLEKPRVTILEKLEITEDRSAVRDPDKKIRLEFLRYPKKGQAQDKCISFNGLVFKKIKFDEN